jgi:hypothetical protein
MMKPTRNIGIKGGGGSLMDTKAEVAMANN